MQVSQQTSVIRATVCWIWKEGRSLFFSVEVEKKKKMAANPSANDRSASLCLRSRRLHPHSAPPNTATGFPSPVPWPAPAGGTPGAPGRGAWVASPLLTRRRKKEKRKREQELIFMAVDFFPYFCFRSLSLCLSVCPSTSTPFLLPLLPPKHLDPAKGASRGPSIGSSQPHGAAHAESVPAPGDGELRLPSFKTHAAVREES